ncbi:maleylpyruvate isomerase family mycothiol-dependent enzyme [Actinophytocola sp.]|uniref:maleylpyruvate isomerase family mycothiol-dependent enzyme n=1 Tax=Actinophytocola sp. TaxID=1872138 RepID=UPI002ED44FB8
MEPNHVAYRKAIHSVTTLVAEYPAPEDLPVPSCPEWTVRDLVSHLVGISAFAIGRMSGWAEVERSSAGLPVDGLLEEWAKMGERLEQLLETHGGRRGSIMVMDAFTHELDLRYALGAPLPVDHPAYDRAFEIVLNGFSAEVAAHNLPAVLISVDGQEWRAGVGEPVATLSGDRYDIYRSLAGRRTHEQITRLGWSRDSHRWLPAFTWGPFTPPTQPVENLVTVA